MKVQIVSLGAGSDTRFWRIATGPLSQNEKLRALLACYLELDFPEITTSKIHAIQQKKELSSVLGKYTISGPTLTSSIYSIRAIDLRDFQTAFATLLVDSTSSDKDQPSLLDPSLPTLVLAECVLVYMDQSQSNALVKWFADTFNVVGAIVYEMFGLNDNFGRVMKENLRIRNVLLPGVDAYPTLLAQSRRFTDHGFTAARSLSLRTIRTEYIDSGELSRIAALELLDEIEELELVLDHYVISWAIKESPAGEITLKTWGLKNKFGKRLEGAK
ncbi:S-adenosyl-L-methionine-dependent methyltransferase [Ramaria rubella]|nr:S-adenosyl-L-methionine-dependent methyltransferase [Ramaria rubella]